MRVSYWRYIRELSRFELHHRENLSSFGNPGSQSSSHSRSVTARLGASRESRRLL
jgi:hypothetical protein